MNVAQRLGNRKGLRVTLLDKNNHHLFQPLLYQVAMAALSPAEIAVPIRTVLAKYKNIDVRMAEVREVDLEARRLRTDRGEVDYDYLVLACGARHGYFGHNEWERFAPGLKRIEQALEIRKRVLTAFEMAEQIGDREEQRQYLTFVVVGGGATGVELAGALGEMSRYTLSREFRQIDPARTRVILIEGGSRILPAFDKSLSEAAARELEKKGVAVWTNSLVTGIDEDGVHVGDEMIRTKTVLWAAGVETSSLNKQLGASLDRAGRVRVMSDLSLEGHAEVFVIGDQACCEQDGVALPGIAPVAIQQGQYLGKLLRDEIAGGERRPFHYFDKGVMATIGRAHAIVQMRSLRFSGFFAWLVWLFIHILYLIGFKNRVLVFIQWAWSYFTFRRGARLITSHEWRDFPVVSAPPGAGSDASDAAPPKEA
ncbi:MAG: NAD(P)/FAD-dependent oxidoreductase, partial [Myxococcales bacterium]|nr:NAD(P)/FAD-dependent oxidoreductase [Myxococcales bacterium]